ncbi:MAG: hypothetical protein RDU83_00260 [bacterium]|nr:hypothetical protein [bacterium]
MVHRGRPLVLGWYAFLAWNVVLFHGLAALDYPVPAKVLAVAASVALAASFLVQIALVVRSQVLPVGPGTPRAAINRRTGEVLSANGDSPRGRRPGAAARIAR